MAVRSTTTEILEWIRERNNKLSVNIERTSLDKCEGWLYDEESGLVRHKNGAFFSIGGLSGTFRGSYVEQPICYQKEIGYLGYLCSVIDGEMHFLTQAKMEPGNISLMQLSPTIQATKSNFEQKHGGRKPVYLDIFKNVADDDVIVDQIQSEQSSRFMGKRNCNIIIRTDDPDSIELTENHRWVSLRQMRELSKYDNLVNMSSRTVLAGIPFSTMRQDYWVDEIRDEALRNSIFKEPDHQLLKDIRHRIVQYKMFNDDDVREVPLMSLAGWELTEDGFSCKEDYPFRLNFCRIAIEGREVREWCQPLFEATGRAFFGLFARDHEGKREWLLRLKPEIGCFDKVELGPTVQREAFSRIPENDIDKLFIRKLEEAKSSGDKDGRIMFDTLLAEEGGRFYHEENRNVILKIEDDEIDELPNDYFWCDYATIQAMNSDNNHLNIQLRSLMSVINL
ncbi:MAG: NDP-hexose 2,3-dehydratase family protein [Mogibacterium sp.]|nr:NDP-hexose 2,3-dehydratase family protein [Mogibacterium sp.]